MNLEGHLAWDRRDGFKVYSSLHLNLQMFLILEFLKKLHRQIGGKVLVIWDGASIHRGQALKNYLAKGAAKWLFLERLPGYAPELNPDEGIWNYLKRVELANTCSKNLNQLYLKLQDAVRRLRRKPRIIQGCIAQAGLTI